MNDATIKVQVLDVQSEQFTDPHPANPGKMKQNLVLALRLVHDLPNFLLCAPPALWSPSAPASSPSSESCSPIFRLSRT